MSATTVFRWKAYGLVDEREVVAGVDREVQWELRGSVTAVSRVAADLRVRDQLDELGLLKSYDGIDVEAPA